MPSRRDVLTTLASAGIAAVGAPLINRGRYRLFGAAPLEYSTRAVDLVRRATVIDMLSPLTLDFPKFGRWMSDPDAFKPDDLTPFRTSGINVFHIAVGTGGPNAHAQTLQFVSSWNSFLAEPGSGVPADRQRRRSRSGEELRTHRRAARGPELRALPHARRRRSVPQPRPARVTAHLQRTEPDRQWLHRAA